MAGSLASIAIAANNECLYCRRQDENSGAFISWSYCQQQDRCVKDAWNLIQNNYCLSGWELGSKYDLDFCQAREIDCRNAVFEPTEDQYGQYFNYTQTLGDGEYCKFKVDARNGVGRVLFKDNSQLGIEDKKVALGQVFTVEGGVEEFVVYNGAQSGTMFFTVSFSGAAHLTLGLAAAAISLTAF